MLLRSVFLILLALGIILAFGIPCVDENVRNVIVLSIFGDITGAQTLHMKKKRRI
jgi:hypothetical protein